MQAEAQNEPKTLQQMIRSLEQYGKTTAVLDFQRENDLAVAYEQLVHDARAFATKLANDGIGARDRVAIFARPSPEFMAASLGIFAAGATVVPIDTQFSDEVLEHVIDESDLRVVVTSTELQDRVQKAASDRVKYYLLDVSPEEPSHWLAAVDSEPAEPEDPVGEDDVACLFYTSGTTGMPKGVPLTHRNVMFQLDSIRKMKLVSADARVLLPLPLHHVYPFVIGMLTPFSLGIAMVLPAALTGPQLLRALNEGEVTHVIGVPRLYEMLLSGLHARIRERGWLMSLPIRSAFAISRFVRRRIGLRVGWWLLAPIRRRVGPHVTVTASGGAPLTDEVAWELESIGWRVAIGYGLTETSPLATINPPGKIRIGSVGKAIEGIELRIAPATDVPEPLGEVQVRGPCVFGGYRNLDEETREAFTEDGWFRTGDIGRLDDDGYLYLAGRLSTMIVTSGGENIQPQTLEDAYAEHRFINEIGVLQHDDRLVAVVLPDFQAIGSKEPDVVDQRLRNAFDERGRTLPSYQRLSDFVVTQSALARTRLGKIQRKTLQEQFEQLLDAGGRSPDREKGPMTLDEMSDHDRELFEAPEARRVWEWLAERYAHVSLTPDTSLRLELDIDSLEWVELSQRIRDLAGVELNEQHASRIETVRELLSEVLEARGEAPGASDSKGVFEDPDAYLNQEQRRGLKPLSAVARPLVWLVYRLNRLLMRLAFRLETTGRENIPSDEPCVICPNHVSYLDALVLCAAIDYARIPTIRWVAWGGGVMRNPIVRFFAQLAQAVPIDVERAGQSSLAAGAAVLRHGYTLILFPEGERSRTGDLQTFRPGVGLLASHLDVPLVPVYIHGAYEALPRGSRRLRFRRIHVVFGEPEDPDKLAKMDGKGEPYERISRALHDVVEELGRAT